MNIVLKKSHLSPFNLVPLNIHISWFHAENQCLCICWLFQLGDEITKDMENMVATVEQLDEDRDHPMVSTIGPRLFELYLALQEFCSFKAHLEPAERRHLAICSYYEWYRPVVNRWLTIAKHKSMQRIKKAVELDRVGTAHSSTEIASEPRHQCNTRFLGISVS